MSTAEYALARTPEEYERLSLQARVWEPATGRLFDRVGLAAGATCLDAGCGPGETMRLMAQRVGPSGLVTGIDADEPLGAQALASLRLAGHRQCAFVAADLTADEPIPGAPYDFVFARLLLFHLPERVDVLARLWDAVVPGGHLVVQDYDVRSVSVLPPLDCVDEFEAFATAAFTAAGADIHVGARLPQLFAEAGVGIPDGTDVAGRLEPLSRGQHFLAGVHNGLLPGALAAGITTAEESAAWHDALARDCARFPDRPVLWPLLIGAWKRKAR